MPITNAGRDHLAAAIVGDDEIAPFNNANSSIGVGDNSATAFSAADTDVLGANKFRKAMDLAFPTRATNVLTFRSTFGTSDANFAWNNWGVFNTTELSGGTMLNRKVESLGTKPNTQTWQFTVSITIASSP